MWFILKNVRKLSAVKPFQQIFSLQLAKFNFLIPNPVTVNNLDESQSVQISDNNNNDLFKKDGGRKNCIYKD